MAVNMAYVPRLVQHTFSTAFFSWHTFSTAFFGFYGSLIVDKRNFPWLAVINAFFTRTLILLI